MAKKKVLTIHEVASRGGKARAKNLSKEERSESSSRASKARWAKVKPEDREEAMRPAREGKKKKRRKKKK